MFFFRKMRRALHHNAEELHKTHQTIDGLSRQIHGLHNELERINLKLIAIFEYDKIIRREIDELEFLEVEEAIDHVKQQEELENLTKEVEALGIIDQGIYDFILGTLGPAVRLEIEVEQTEYLKGSLMAELNTNQQISLSVLAKDAANHTVDLPGDVVWGSSDEAVVTVTPDALDPSKAVATVVATDGGVSAYVTASSGDLVADALLITVVDAPAVSLVIVPGDITQKA